MKKFMVLLFGVCILGFNAYGLSTNSYYVQILMNTSTPFVYARIVLVVVLLAYVSISRFRIYTTRALVGTSGILLLSLGLISVGSPSLLGHINTQILLGDSVTLIEAGILAITMGAELPARRSRFVADSFYFVKSLFAAQPKMVASYSQTATNAYQNTSMVQNLLSEELAVPVFRHLVRGYTVAHK